MIRKHNVGRLLVWSGALLPVLLWLLTEAAEPRGRGFYSNVALVNVGQVSALVGMAMLSIAFVLSSRVHVLEDYFGGLDKMYRVHHQLGLIAFILLLVHPVALALRFIPDRFSSALLFLAVLGTFFFCYKLVVLPFVSWHHMYTVGAVSRLSDQVLRIELSPQRRAVSFVPGQFVFVTFYQEELSRESHPFTICTVPEQQHIDLTVKALGDFTEALYRQLRSGARAKVEGPYGRFNYQTGSPQQIWIGAGVGIAPFLSWAHHMEETQDSTFRAMFYYCVHSRSDAVQYQEFERIAARSGHLQVALVCSEEQGHLRAENLGNLDDKDIFMCGPRRFTIDLQRQLLQLGVPRARIHFEDFEFR